MQCFNITTMSENAVELLEIAMIIQGYTVMIWLKKAAKAEMKAVSKILVK